MQNNQKPPEKENGNKCKMKTNLPQAITTPAEAAIFLTELYNNGESYHPDDDATEFFGPVDGAQLNKLMEDIHNLPGNEGYPDESKMVFEPCGFLLDLDPDYKRDADDE